MSKDTIFYHVISIEGIDGCGKTTLIKNLKEYYQKNFEVDVYSFPNRTTPIGKIIDSALKKEIKMDPIALQYLFSANKWELQPEIKKSIFNKHIILIDRYTDSSIVYSEAQNISKKRILRLDEGLLEPSLRIFIDISPEKIVERNKTNIYLSEKNELYETKPFLTLVYDGYTLLFDEYILNKQPVLVVPGEKSPLEMLEMVILTINEQLEKKYLD